MKSTKLFIGIKPTVSCESFPKKYIFKGFFSHFSIFSYFLATPEHFPGQQHLYRVSSVPPSLGTPLHHPRCLTCSGQGHNMSPNSITSTSAASAARMTLNWVDDFESEENGDSEKHTLLGISPHAKRKSDMKNMACQYYVASFAPNNNEYALIECLGPEIPTSAIYKISVKDNMKPLTLIYMLQNNTELRENLESIALPQVKTFPVLISGGYHAQVRMYLPPGLREDEITKYPMILHV